MEAQGLRDDLKEKTEKLRTLTTSEQESRKLAEDLQAELTSSVLMLLQTAVNSRIFKRRRYVQYIMYLVLRMTKSFIFNLGLHDDAVEFSKE